MSGVIDFFERMAQAGRAFLHDMLLWVEGFAHSPYGTWALFLVSFAESSFFPIPPDVLLIALCLSEPERSLWYALVCSVASVLGGVAGYGIGLYGGRPLLLRIFSRERIDAVSAYFDRYNAWAVGIAGLTPIPYKVFTVSGGAFKIGFRIFVLASAASRSLRFFVIAVLMWFFGAPIRDFIETYLGWLFLAFVALLVGGFWIAGRGAILSRRRPAPSADAFAPGGGDDDA
ncbi:MAG: YqaA family protein [Acidobacteriota bacterium]